MSNRKTALITGITGQDGAYLAEFLLDKGYVVHGLKRRASSFNTERIDHLYQDPHEEQIRFKLHYGDLTDSMNIVRVIQEIQPDEIYNLAAQSHVKVSFETPEYTTDTDGMGVIRILEAIRILGLEKKTKLFQASTSEMFGNSTDGIKDENTPFHPRSPYAIAKLLAYWNVVNHREAYNIFATNGIMFNHESPLRGGTFVTRKITSAVAAIHLEQQECLHLGNLDARRDWGHAKDYVEGMWRALQHDTPDDFVFATGETRSVREFVEKAFSHIGYDIQWKGSDLAEIGIDKKTGKTLVSIDPRYFRPTEVDYLQGDASKAKNALGWNATTTFDELVTEMMESDLNRLKQNNQPAQQQSYG